MARRIVAFLDVLGFKSLVERVPQSELVEIYGRLLREVRDQTTIPVFPEDPRKFEQDAHYEDDEIAKRRVVNVVVASDSIVLYSQGERYGDVLAVAAAVRSLLVAGFRSGVPLRGALTIGELDEVGVEDDALGHGWTAHFSGLVGLGLVRAYELEARSGWSGAVLHPDLVAHLDGTPLVAHGDETTTSALDQLCHTQLVVQTAATDETQWAIHWPHLASFAEPPVGEDQVAAAFTSFGRTAPSAGVAAKREATLAFMRRAEAEAHGTRRRRLERSPI